MDANGVMALVYDPVLRALRVDGDSEGGGAVDSVDGRTGTVTLTDLYDAEGAAQAVDDALDTHIADSTAHPLQANNQTGTTYTLVLGDGGKAIECNNASPFALTVPTNASVAFPIGTVIEVFQQGTGQVTVSGGGVTFRAPGGAKTRVQYSVISLWKRGTDEWVISGDTVT